MEKTKKFLKYLQLNNISVEEAIEVLQKVKNDKKPREKAIVKSYETR